MTRKAYRSHDEATIESFRRDPAFAAEYINAILTDGDDGELLVAVRQVAKAFGGVSHVATVARLNKSSLYRTLASAGNPEVKTLRRVLRAMKLELAVRPTTKRSKRVSVSPDSLIVWSKGEQTESRVTTPGSFVVHTINATRAIAPAFRQQFASTAGTSVRTFVA